MKTDLKDQKVFKDFCEIDVDRKNIIISVLESEDIPYTLITLDSSEHIVVFPLNLVTDEQSTVMLAHYDRVEGTPGANDNSASVFYLLYHAKRLKELKHSTIIIFTDREEIGGADSVTDQGSYALGRYFKSKKIKNLSFYVFDMCGIGTTILLGTAGENLIKDHYKENYSKSKIKNKIDNVKRRAEEILLTVNNGEFFYMTPLFSDDLGLILNEYPAILISLLPYREAIEYKNSSSRLPRSWQNNHTMDDTTLTLDNRSWDILSPLLLSLSKIKKEESVLHNSELFFNCYTQELQHVNNKTESIKPLINYIDKELFNISSIETNNREILTEFLLFSSKLNSNVIDFFRSVCDNKTDDLSYNIYIYLKEKYSVNYNKLPLIVRRKIEHRTNLLGFSDSFTFLYDNIISSIENKWLIHSNPLKNRERIDIQIEMINITTYKLILKQKMALIGKISLINDAGNFIMDSGYFNPELFLKLDHLNILKGIRIVLIKWLKLNNNDSLRFNLSRSKWIGCDQFYRLIKIELEGRHHYPTKSDLIYIWKR